MSLECSPPRNRHYIGLVVRQAEDEAKIEASRTRSPHPLISGNSSTRQEPFSVPVQLLECAITVPRHADVPSNSASFA